MTVDGMDALSTQSAAKLSVQDVIDAVHTGIDFHSMILLEINISVKLVKFFLNMLKLTNC